MTEKNTPERSRRLVWALIIVAGVVLVVAIGLVLSGRLRNGGPEAAPAGDPALPSPSASALCTPAPTPECPAQRVTAGLETIVTALQNSDLVRARQELEAALVAFADLTDQPACGAVAQQLLGLQALVAASEAWDSALSSGSVLQTDEAARLAGVAAGLTARSERGGAGALAAGLVTAIDEWRSLMEQAIAPGRVMTQPETIATELAGGLHPLCEVNSLIKPLLTDRTGGAVETVSRMEILSDTLFAIAGGQLMMVDLERVHGPSPAAFLQPVVPDDGAVIAGAPVIELVDLTGTATGDLLLLEKSGRLLRRTLDNEWSLERPAEADEMPVAVAPFGGRSYLLDPGANDIWRDSPGGETEGYPAAFFLEGAVRDMSSAVDVAIDGAIYVAHRTGITQGRVRRYFAGVEDPMFRPDTDLGTSVAIFLPDEPQSVLVYVVDGSGLRVLGLDRETGSFRLGFEIHVGDTGLLTSGDINGGWLYLTDGETLFITALSPHATAAMDCPAVPFPHPALFDQSELATMEMQLPVSATLPSVLSHYPGGRWPEFGYGLLDGLILSDAPYSDTVRAAAPGTISRIVVDPPPLLEADYLVISNTRRVPPDVGETLWGNQVWIDHGNGIQTRYGGLSILPSLQKGQTVHRLAILGYAGDGPVLFGLWANDVYLGYGRSMPETITGYRALFEGE